MTTACSIHVRGVVQGVGFRPFVYRLARANTLAGWVLNGDEGVEIHLEGERERLDAFLDELRTGSPAAATITAIDVDPAVPSGIGEFIIKPSRSSEQPTTGISPDLALCRRCLAELFDPADPRYRYPYINCTACGPRYSIMRKLPYDRAATTMTAWAMDEDCAHEYYDPLSRRFHAQPVACPSCGPHYQLRQGTQVVLGDDEVAQRSAELLRSGAILAVKGIGGYHLACDARNRLAVAALRERKFRKEKPFALMARDLDTAASIIELSPEARAVLASPAAPIVLAPARVALPHVAPGNRELGVMLPYAPLHYLLFDAGAPEVLVMTSANRSSEPIAYHDEDARVRLGGLADAFLVGERPIARRVEDSVVRVGRSGAVLLRRGRGYAPAAAAAIPAERPVLALGADLKNAITLVVDGQAFVSQYIGDLDQYESARAFQETIDDLLAMYQVPHDDLLVVHDAHPQYRSTAYAARLAAREVVSVQHHRAHIASVLAERDAWDEPVIGLSLDGTGYGDDGTIWGGEVFAGSMRTGLRRVAHLRPAALPGGDAAAQHPVQAAAGFLDQLDDLPDFTLAPFEFPIRYESARRLLRSGTRVFTTTSAGRLFDVAAALVGFTRPVTFEGQAAIWLEHLARQSASAEPYDFPLMGEELDWRPFLYAVLKDRRRGRDPADIARAFHLGVARGLCRASVELCRLHGVGIVAASGGVFQNALLVDDLLALLEDEGVTLWLNHAVPPNDGGVSLGQAALGALR
jgi:hydrogenase maturation protein HypF